MMGTTQATPSRSTRGATGLLRRRGKVREECLKKLTHDCFFSFSLSLLQFFGLHPTFLFLPRVAAAAAATASGPSDGHKIKSISIDIAPVPRKRNRRKERALGKGFEQEEEEVGGHIASTCFAFFSTLDLSPPFPFPPPTDPPPTTPTTGSRHRSRDAAAAALTSHAISTSPSSLTKADSAASVGGGLAVVSEDDECYFDARSDDEGGGGSSVGSHEGVGPSLSFWRRAGSGGAAAAASPAPGFFSGVAAAVAARLGFGDAAAAAAASSSPPPPLPPPSPAAAAPSASAPSSFFSFPWFSLRRSASSSSMPSSSSSPAGGGREKDASPFAAAAAAGTPKRATGASGRTTTAINDRDRDHTNLNNSHPTHRRSLSLNPRPVAGPGGQPSMELAPGVVVPADVVLQPEPPPYGSPRVFGVGGAGAGAGAGGEHGGGGNGGGDGVVVPGACKPLLSLARESLGARGLGGLHLSSLRRQQQQQHRATFVQTVRPNAGDSGLRRAPEYESESESDEEGEEGERRGETGTEAASSSSSPSPSSSPQVAAASAKAAAEGGEKPQWHRRFNWNPTSLTRQQRRQAAGGAQPAPQNGHQSLPPLPPPPPLPLLTETYGPCDATTFRVRSKDYLRSKIKQASPEAIYELVAADLYSFDFKINHIAKHVVLPPLPAPSPGHAALAPHDRLPPLLVLNIQLPTYPASIWGGGGGGGGGDGNASPAPPSSSADGRGHSLVFYFRLPDNWDPAAYESSHPAASPALGLARRLVHNGRELDGSPTRDRLKLIARVANPAEWAREAPLSSAESRLLGSYNDKPLLTRPQHKFFHGPGEKVLFLFF